MARAEDLRAMRDFLQDERYRIDMQLLDLDRRIMLAEHGAPPPVLNPGRRRDDMPLPHSQTVHIGAAELSSPVMLNLGEEAPEPKPATCGPFDEEYHGVPV